MKPGGKIIIVDNAGEDEFCTFAKEAIYEGPDFYLQNGFTPYYISTSFQFKSLEDAKDLMTLFFKDNIKFEDIRLEYAYRVVAYMKALPLQD